VASSSVLILLQQSRVGQLDYFDVADSRDVRVQTD
jgi:hypothetical protein